MLSVSLGLAAVNQAVKEGKASQTLRVMRLPEVALRGVVAECAAAYQTELSALLRAKHMEGQSSCHITRCLITWSPKQTSSVLLF